MTVRCEQNKTKPKKQKENKTVAVALVVSSNVDRSANHFLFLQPYFYLLLLLSYLSYISNDDFVFNFLLMVCHVKDDSGPSCFFVDVSESVNIIVVRSTSG